MVKRLAWRDGSQHRNIRCRSGMTLFLLMFLALLLVTVLHSVCTVAVCINLRLVLVRVSSRARVRIGIEVRVSVMVRVSIRTSWVVNFALFRCYRPVIYTRTKCDLRSSVLVMRVTTFCGHL